MQILKDNHIIHGVFGCFVIMGCDTMCVCDYVKDLGSVGHNPNGLEIIETMTQMLFVWRLSEKEAHVLSHEYKQHPNHAFVVG